MEQAALQNMNMDIIFTILGLVGPLDILSLRLCCKSMHSATISRCVWIDALHTICLKFGIFGPSFDTQLMTLKEIENATLHPYRFVRRVASYAEIVPAYIRSVAHRRGDPAFYLVPGGRFLLMGEQERLSLWDLGLSSARWHDPRLLHSIAVQRAPRKLYVRPTSDGQGLLVLPGSGFSAGQLIDVQILEIRPTSATPTFTFRARLTMEHSVSFSFELDGNLVAFISGDRASTFVTIWDFDRDEWITMPVDHVIYNICLVAERRQLLLHVDLSRIIVCWIPHLEPRASQKPIMHDLQMVRVIDIPDLRSPEVRMNVYTPSCSASWHQPSTTRTRLWHIAIHGGHEDGINDKSETRIVLRIPLDGNAVSGVESDIEADEGIRHEKATIEYADRIHNGIVDSVYWGEDLFLSTRLTAAGAWVRLSNSRLEPLGPSTDTCIWRADYGPHDRRDVPQVDLVSGRACVYLRDKILILDYLPPVIEA